MKLREKYGQPIHVRLRRQSRRNVVRLTNRGRTKASIHRIIAKLVKVNHERQGNPARNSALTIIEVRQKEHRQNLAQATIGAGEDVDNFSNNSEGSPSNFIFENDSSAFYITPTSGLYERT